MKTITEALQVEDNPGNAGLPHEMFGEDGSLGVDLSYASFMTEAASHFGDSFLPTKVKLFRRELGR